MTRLKAGHSGRLPRYEFKGEDTHKHMRLEACLVDFKNTSMFVLWFACWCTLDLVTCHRGENIYFFYAF